MVPCNIQKWYRKTESNYLSFNLKIINNLCTLEPWVVVEALLILGVIFLFSILMGRNVVSCSKDENWVERCSGKRMIGWFRKNKKMKRLKQLFEQCNKILCLQYSFLFYIILNRDNIIVTIQSKLQSLMCILPHNWFEYIIRDLDVKP